MPEEPDKIFDISKPGKTAAEPSSKPIIVSNKPALQDPMVKEKIDDFLAQDLDEPKKPEKKPETSEEKPKIAAEKVKIEPIKETEKTDEEKEATKETPQEDKETPKDKKEPKETNDQKGVVGAIVDQASEKRKAEIEDQDTKKREKEISRLVESKKYFVPIGEKKRKRKTRHLLLLLVFVLIASVMTVDLLLDAKLIEINSIKPFTNFIKN